MFVTLLNWKVERVSLPCVVHRFNLEVAMNNLSTRAKRETRNMDLQVSTVKFPDDFSHFSHLRRNEFDNNGINCQIGKQIYTYNIRGEVRINKRRMLI